MSSTLGRRTRSTVQGKEEALERMLEPVQGPVWSVLESPAVTDLANAARVQLGKMPQQNQRCSCHCCTHRTLHRQCGRWCHLSRIQQVGC